MKNMPDFSRTPIPAAKPWLTDSLPELHPNGGMPKGRGLSYLLIEVAIGGAQAQPFE